MADGSAFDVPRSGARTDRVARAMLLCHRMKTVLFIVFLALGPALADQLAVAPAHYAVAMATPFASLGAAAANRSAVDHATTPSERAALCGRGS